MPRENSAMSPERAFDNDGYLAARGHAATLGLGAYQVVQ
jgi:hypothetical protein